MCVRELYCFPDILQYFPRHDQKCPYTHTHRTHKTHIYTRKQKKNILTWYANFLSNTKSCKTKFHKQFSTFLTYSDFRSRTIPIPTCFWPSMYNQTPPPFYYKSCHELLSVSFRIAALKNWPKLSG